MSGIYIHIPFCKQACHYCDFHFSTSMKKKDEMVAALCKEIELRKAEISDFQVETIYFGGGTPSILGIEEIQKIIDTVYVHYEVVEKPEITLEANPDDLDSQTLKHYANSPINRLSIGVQSFFEDDLQLMNRAHNAHEAKKCIEEATHYFHNISIDLIYGIPGMTHEKWKATIQTALSFGIPHISSYALTVEPKTALDKLIKNNTIDAPKDEEAQEHFHILFDELEKKGFVHYELSNFGKHNYFSKNNTAYWLGNNYLGIGPSAHSYNGFERSWNIKNNALYLKSLAENKLPSKKESLTLTDRYNEYIMTGLRTIWGVSLQKVEDNFGQRYLLYLIEQSKKYLDDDFLQIENDVLTTTKKGKFLSDGIASDLFLLNLE